MVSGQVLASEAVEAVLEQGLDLDLVRDLPPPPLQAPLAQALVAMEEVILKQGHLQGHLQDHLQAPMLVQDTEVAIK